MTGWALALVGPALTGCAALHSWVAVEGQHPASFQKRIHATVDGQFLLFLPRGFEPHGHAKYPLLIFLHGSGEAGNDLNLLKIQGPPKIVESQPDFPFIVASPQSPLIEERGFDLQMLDALLDELLARLPIDRDRVYLTGLSMGGIWSYGWASLHPERFAAIAPVSATWDPAEACRLKGVPIWAFHGEIDDVVPLAGEQAMIDAINACGGSAKLTVYPGVGHGAWTPAYDDPALYQWLLEHRRTSRPAK